MRYRCGGVKRGPRQDIERSPVLAEHQSSGALRYIDLTYRCTVSSISVDLARRDVDRAIRRGGDTLPTLLRKSLDPGQPPVRLDLCGVGHFLAFIRNVEGPARQGGTQREGAKDVGHLRAVVQLAGDEVVSYRQK